MKCRDDDGRLVGAGDTITFSYGIPPRVVDGRVVQMNGSLWVDNPGHTPSFTKLRSLRLYVGSWWKKEDA